MLVREIMTSPAYIVHQDASLEEALTLMASARVTSLPVVDGGTRVVGIISEADLLRADLEPDPRAQLRPARQPAESRLTAVSQVMTVNPHTVGEDSDVAELARTFATTSWKSVPVVRGGLLLGVVSRSDVIRAMSRSDEDIVAEISRTLWEIGLRTWHVDVTDGVAHITGEGSENERGAAMSIAQSVMGVRHVTAQVPEA